ncbi:muscle M-line assembly protein unc-89 isoform X4 [Lucilia cuprina]|uniref:muscle M-line assembly protein unc-89 isoform X4 n=1 Tax=Lucilia cuprina TaxID=7375 RepID=UPI001F0611EF|nr:muscle M-line assembly protein unc-89 isoform X4 [Lucilia cuprina]
MENTNVNPLKSPSSANPSDNESDTKVKADTTTLSENPADSRNFPLGGNEHKQSNHKPPKISFSENSSSLIRCMPNERATFFVKIDTEEDDADILPLEFEWSRGEIPIYNSDRFRITKTSTAVQLAVEHVQREDAGHYTLFAKTKSNDVIRKDVQLIVEDRSTGDDPPVFLRRLLDLQVRVGSSTRLITEIRSSSDVKLTWFRNDRRVCESDRIKEVHEGNFHYLEINPVVVEDGGQWMVMAENFSGRNSCISNLTVLVPKAYKAPEFIEELRAILTQQGTVSLECKVVGVPTPQLRWFKDSKEIKAGDVFALTANADDPTSLGTYTCEAVNCVGKAYSSSKLHVVGRGSREGSLKPADSATNTAPPPIFTNELKNASVRIGDTIILGCQVAVPPWPQSVVWYNKNGRVESGDRYKYIEDGLGVYMIEVKPSEACDEGEWKCVVTNEESCVGISSCVVDMEIPKNYRKPRFMESLRAVLTEEGLVSFECKVVGFPTPQLKWFKDGQELKPGDVYQLTGTNSLGTYCCIAKNCMGETSSIAVLTVEDIQNQLNDEERLTFATSTSQPPKFLMGLKSEETKINEPYQFTVKVEATPDPLLSWFRDELPIESNDRYNHYRGEENNWHLDIRNLEFIDQAEWKCVAVNDFGTTVTSCFLKLQIPRHYKKPRFLECLRAVLTEEGAVNLECKVIGVPQPALKWYKDGVELKPGDIHKIISGQDGTCCLGTYTCEARNCMGVVASSAALLGFEDDYSKQESKQQNELQRNFSLSTIQEEHTSQLYETPQGDITITERGDVSFSFDGKEVSVSLYETPDLTEEEALKIVEMYADQISEHVTEHNVVELPPLRFVKETSQSGKLLMEAVVIDISPEYFSHEEDLRTEAGMDDISINEITIHGSSLKDDEELDRQTEDFARTSFEKMEEELSLTAPIRKRKKSKPTETEEFFSFSKASDGSVDENTSELQTFASAQMSKMESLENSKSLSESIQAPARKKGKKQSDSESSKTTENEAQLQDISGAVGDGLKVTSDKPLKVVSNEADIERNLKSLLPLAKLLKVLDGHLNAVESEVIQQSVMLMTPSSADQSIAIIKNIIDPISQIQSKLKVYSGETPLDALFETMNDDIRSLHVALQVIEKCVEIDETGTTLIQRTSVCIIDSIADHLIRALDEVKMVSNMFENESLKSNLQLTVDDIKQGLEITKDTIKSQALLQEAQEIEATKHFTETVAKLQDIPEPLPFAKVAEANLPKYSESVTNICEPVLRIQAALEKVENELTLEESDEDIYKKVHEKIMHNLVEPINELQSVVAEIEGKVSSLSGTDSIEQKVNMAILDIVSPPLFELNKGLEIIQQQPSHNIEAGKLTVSTVESMVPPLQEIQNGLAQLSQDILSGQLNDDQLMDTDDLKKLLQSLAQAVLHLESNIDNITSRLPQNVSMSLSKLREEISSLIGQVIDKDIDKYHLTVLENIKRPIDELNYCIRQIEQKSISGSLTDLVDPLHSLNDKVKMSQEVLQLSTTKQNFDIVETLDKMRNLIKHIEIDIEENEFKNMQKEIALDEEQAIKDNNIFLTMRQEMEMRIELEESLKEIEKLNNNIKYLEENTYLDKELKSQFCELAKPFEQVIDILTNKESLERGQHSLQSSLNILRNTAKNCESLNQSLEKLKAVKSKSEFSKIFYTNCRTALEELKATIDQLEYNDVTATPVVTPFNKILVALENIIPKLVTETAVEDLSTLEEVSALKSAAESLPLDSDRASLPKDSKEEISVCPLKSFEEKKQQVDELLGQLKNSIASVLAHCNDYDMGSLRIEAVEQMKATVNKMTDFKQCLEQTLQPHVLDVVHTSSECTDLRTMAEAVCSLENCALQIQEYIDNFDVKDLSGDEISELKTMAQPLKELVEGVKVFYNQELEQVETMNTLSAVSMSSAKVLQSLRPYVLAVHEHQALETLESLADTQTFSHLKEFVQPLRELEKAAICTEENLMLSQMSNLSEQTSLEVLKTWAKPLLSLKEAIVNVKQEQAFSALEEYPAFRALKEKSSILFNLLKYCENFDAQIFENIEDLSLLNISHIKSYAESATASAQELMEPAKTHVQEVKTFDLKDCVKGGIKQIEECLHNTKQIQDFEVTSLEDIMQELKNDLQNMENNLLKSNEKTEDLIAKETKVAKTMFKLKECLVHTYEATDLETGLEDIEKTFEDLLQAMPSLELQLALEMKEKIILGFSEFIVACLQTTEQQQSFETLIQPFRNLMETVDIISKLNKIDVEPSSSVMIQLQTQLMTAFRALNDVSEKSNQEILPNLLKTQNTLVLIYDFIENNEGNLRIIELLQEIDYLTPELREIKDILASSQKHASEEMQMQLLLENVNSAQLFLMEIHEGLLQNNALVHAFMQDNRDTVESLKNLLNKVENKLHSKTVYEVEQEETIGILRNLLNNLKANMARVNEMHLREIETELEQKGVSEAKKPDQKKKQELEKPIEQKQGENQNVQIEDKPVQLEEESFKKDEQTNVEQAKVNSESETQKKDEFEASEQTKTKPEPETQKKDQQKDVETDSAKPEDIGKKAEQKDVEPAAKLNEVTELSKAKLEEETPKKDEQKDVNIASTLVEETEPAKAKPVPEEESSKKAEQKDVDTAAKAEEKAAKKAEKKDVESAAKLVEATEPIKAKPEEETPKQDEPMDVDTVSTLVEESRKETPKKAEEKDIDTSTKAEEKAQKKAEQKDVESAANLVKTAEPVKAKPEEETLNKDEPMDVDTALSLVEEPKVETPKKAEQINDDATSVLTEEAKPEPPELTPLMKNVLQLINTNKQYLETIKPKKVKQSTSEFVKSVMDNLKELQLAIEVDTPTNLEDRLFLPLFKTKQLITYAANTESTDEITHNVLENLKHIMLNIINDNDKLRKSILYEVVEAVKPNVSQILEKIESQPKKSKIIQKAAESLNQIVLEINNIYQNNLGNLETSSTSFKALKSALSQLNEVTEEISAIKPNVLNTIKLNRLMEKLDKSEVKDALEILLDLENMKEMFEQLLETIQSQSLMQHKPIEETVANALEVIGDNSDLEDIKKDLQETLDSSNNEQKRKCIFKLREHIVHTYDGGLNEELENVIDSILGNNSDLIESINAEYLKNINNNFTPVCKQIDEVTTEPWHGKLTGLTTKLSNIQNIADRLKTVKDFEKSSINSIELQKNLMDIFVLFDDMLEIATSPLNTDVEKVKSLALKQYDSIENSTVNIKTLQAYENMLDVCKLIKIVVEKVCEKSKSQEMEISVEKLEEKQVETKKAKEKELKTTKDIAEVSEVKAEKLEEKKMEDEAKKAEEKDLRTTKEKAEVSEVKHEQLEEKKVEDDAKKAEEKDLQTTKEKAEVSEVKAEKLEEKKMEAEAKKVEEKDLKTTKEKAEVSEVKAEKLEEKKMEAEATKAEEKELKTTKKKAEVSEVKAEKLEEKKMEAEAKKAEEKDLKTTKEKAEVSEVKAEKLEEKKVETEAKKAEEKDLKTTKEKAEVSEVKAEKLEEKKMESEAKKAEEKELKATKEKAEVSEVKAEKLEEKKMEAEAKKAEENDLKTTKEKAEVSEIKAEKLEEKKVEAEAKKAEEKDLKTTKEKAEVSEVKAEKLEEKKVEAESKKAEEKDLKTTKEKAEVSELKAEQLEEKKVEAEAKKAEEKDLKTTKEKAEVSEVKAEQLEEKKVEAEAKKAEETELKTTKEKAEVSEVKAEKIEEMKMEAEAKKAEEKELKATKEKAEVSEVKAEKLDEKKMEAEAKKAEEKELKATKEKAEVSEVKAEKLEEKKMDAEAKKAEEKDLKTTKEKAEVSEVKAEKLEEMKMEAEAKKAEEKELKATKEKAEVSEVKAEKLDEKKMEAEAKKAEEKELKATKEKAEVSEVKAEKLEEKKMEAEAKKAAELDLKTTKEKAEVSEVKAEKLEEKKVEAEAKKAEEKELKATKEKAEVSEVKSEKLEEKKIEAEAKKAEEKELKDTKEKAEVSEVKAEKLEEKKMEAEAKKAEEKELKATKEKAEVSEGKAEQLEEKKMEAEAKKAEEKNLKPTNEKAEVSEAKAEKLEEKKVEAEAKKAEEKDLKTTKEKAEVSEVKSEKLEEKKVEAEAKKAEEKELKATKEKAEVSEVKAHKLEEKKMEAEAKKVEEKELKTTKEKAEVSEVKTEKVEEMKVEAEAKKAEEKDLKTTKEKAEVSEVKAEKLEEKKVETEAKKTEEKDLQTTKEKAEVSEVKAEKLEEKKMEDEAKKAEEKDLQTTKEKAEVSEVKAEKLEEKKMEAEAKKAEEKDLKTTKEKAEVSEVKAEKLDKKKVEAEAKKAEEKDLKTTKEKAEVSEVKAEKLEEKKMEAKAKKAEEKDLKTTKEKAEVFEVKAEKLEEKKVETEAKKAEEKELKATKEKVEVSEVKAEKVEEMKVEAEAKKAKEKDLKTTKEKAEVSEVKSEKLEEKKMEAEAKKAEEKELKDTKEKAEVSEVKAEKLEEKKMEAEAKKAEEKELKGTKEKAEVSEVRAEKLEEKKVETEAKKTEEKDLKTTKEKAGISEVKAEKAEEKKLEAEATKPKEKELKATKDKAEISEVKAEKVEENKVDAQTKTAEEKDLKSSKDKAEISEAKAAKLEEKKVEVEAKNVEEKDVKTTKEKAEISEINAEAKAEAKKLKAEEKKADEEDVNTTKEKAEISQAKAEKVEEKKLKAKTKKTEEKDVKTAKEKAEISEVKTEKLEEKKMEAEAKKAEEKDLKTSKERAKIEEKQAEETEMKTTKEEAEKLKEKKLEVDTKKTEEAKSKKAQEKELKTAEEKAEISEVKGEKIEEEKLDRESAENKAEIMDKNLEAKKLKSKDVESEKLEDNKLKTKTKKSKQKEEPAVETKAEIAEVEKKQQKEEDNDVKAVSAKTEISEVEQKKYVEVKADKSEVKTDLKKSEVDSTEKLSVKESDKPKKSNEYMDLKEQRNAKRMPSVDIKLTNRNSSVGSDIKLTCGISGNDVEIRWFKENTAIENSAKYKITQKDGLSCLEIKSADLQDAAVYRCVAANRNGEVETSCLVTLYDVPTNKFGTPPIFTRNIRDAYHSHENHITLECKVSGNPKPNVYWQKDNTLLSEEGNKYKFTDLQDGVRQLIIQNPVKEDTGLYTCYAESESGQMKISKFVDISDYMKKITERRASKSYNEQRDVGELEKAKDEVDNNERQEQKLRSREAKFKLNVETPMKPMTIASGTKAQLICYVSGLIEDVYWLRGDERVTKDSRHKIYNINGALSLEIYDARPDDTGEYKCVVRNNRNSTESICKLTVYDSTKAELPTSFSGPVTATFDAARCEIILSCNVHGRPCVTWIRDDHTISNNRYRSVEGIGGVRKLIIRNPIPSDCGTFSCFAETNEGIESITKVIKIADLKKLMTAAAETEINGFSDTSEDKLKRTLNVVDNDSVNQTRLSLGRSTQVASQRKPLFSTLLHDRTVAECSNVRLSCSVVYDGCTSIEWLKDNQPLPKDTRYQTIFHNGEAILEIFAAQESDSGRYTCRATNDYGESLSQSQLRIYKHYEDAPQPATFVQSIKDTYSINENELVLDCRVRGKPRPEIQWLKGTDMLMPGDKYIQIDQPDGYSKLIVTKPTEKDSGLYACVARNEVAESKITHQVDFKGRERFALEKTMGYFHRDPNKPHFVTPLGNQTVCNGGTIAISAEFMQTHTPIDVQWFRDRQPLAGQPNVTTFYEHGVYTLAIMNAQAENEGTYTCRAQNAFGRIESHANVDVAVGVSKDERPPLFLSRPETEMKIAVGDPFSISFRIAGDPKPRLTFMKGTKDITKSDRVSKEVSDDYTRFTVQKSQISDSGTYFVVARNNNGTDRIFVTVEVMPRARSETPSAPRWGLALESYPDVSYFKDPPAAISTEPLLIDSGPTHISLSWGKPPTNNSAPVIAYRVDAWVVGHDGGAMWKELGLTPINSFDAFNLKSNVEYHFRVTPKNRYGWGPSVQTSAPLQVGGVECLPEFTVILPGQVKALLNKEFVLEAVVRGTPRPDIVWYKDGLRISSNVESERVKTRKIGSTCTLTIKQVTETDAGRYTCEATNSKGRVSTFARLQVVSDPKLFEADNRLKEIVRQNNLAAIGDTLPIFTMRLRDRRVQVTYPVRLTCQVVGHPQPEITWYKDDELLQSNRRCLITEENQFFTLELASAQLSDSGIYTCTAKNELGSVSCHCSLVVDKGIRAYISPEFYMPLDPLYIVQEGQELRLTAKVEAYPAVGVSWHRNGVKLRPSRRLAVSLDANGLVELIISETTIRDAGIYTCVASNAVGKQESMCRVCIEQLEEEDVSKQITRSVPAIFTNDMPYSKEPLFLVKPRSSEAYEGDTVIIFCEVVGDPKPDVVWLRDFLNPEYYKDAPHFRRIGEGTEYRLEIPYAKLDFTGTYSVIASNCHGEAKAVISLQIFAKDILKQKSMEKGSIRHGNIETLPRFIRHLRNLRCCDGDAITLEAHVEGLPEPVIIWEKDGRVLPSGKDFEMTYDGIKATLSIPRVYPEDEGEYTCIAKNNIGRTLSSACIIVDVPEEKENMLNRQLTRPTGFLSATSTPLSTPRSTPIRSFSPTRRLSYRNSIIDISEPRSSRGRSVVDGRQAISAPKFLAIPNSRVVEEGDSVRFQCAIAGHPMPWATWDKDGIIVTPTTRIAIKEVNDLRYLEIEEVTFDDAGLYRITLENDYGRIEATARLDVIGSSRYSKSPSARSIRASSSKRNAYLHRRIMGPSTAIGGRMALASGFRGSSVPSCKFYHNGLELQESERVHVDLLQEEAFLFVDNVSKDDEGLYTCVIEGHEHEPITTSTVVKFLTVEELQQPSKTQCEIVQHLPDEIEHWEGETIDLCFELKTNMPYTYMWTRNGELIKESDDFNYIDHGNGFLCLRIHDAFDLDSGCYTCIVTTLDGFQCSTFTNLNIGRNSEIIADNSDGGLALMKSLLPVVADCGVKATFCARVFPADAEVCWYVCGRQVVDNVADDDSCEFTLESSSTDGLRILHINDVTLAHSGEVQLVVTHPGKPHSSLKSYTSLAVIPRSTTALKVLESTEIPIDLKTDLNQNHKNKDRSQPAYILEGPKDCTALIGGCVRLSVIFEGLPKPQVRWFKASRPIVETSNIIINTSTRKSILQISDIVTDDSGKYTVEVMNEFGNDVAVASVAVEGPPEPPSGKPSISQGPDRVSIAWCGPPYDGGCMITGFIIEMQELLTSSDNENEAAWLEIASVVDSLAYTVKDLKPLCTYRFRVRAENVHGRSEPGLPSDRVHVTEENEDLNDDFLKSISIKAGGDFKNCFDILEELGKGRFGIVYKVQEKDEPKRICAAKIIKCIKSRDRVKVQEEISIMRSLKHPKLLQLAASFESSREIVMVMEYITGGELFERVVADDFTLTERDCVLFVRQVCEGVAYMHSQSIVHLDLKPENIMCKTRTCHQIKIIDFGLAQRLNTGSPVRVLFGTPEFIPPEIISYEPIGFQSDMWSVGVICYVLLSGLSPFMGDSDVETFSNITRADYDFDDDAFDCVSQQAKDFISNLLVHRKEDRWTAEQCLESAWLKQGHQDDNLSNKKICTDKLKKFIIRRKWQKTGNAIRALGRMATLSASRRNSVASNAGSVSNSPRPSVSGVTILNPNISVQMGSLHEEDDDFSIELPSSELKRRNPTVLHKSQCSERSDSGYSECSNCSASGTIQCQCSSNNKDSVDQVTNEDLSLSVPHDLLKLKLEEIAHQADSNIEEVKLELVVPNEKCPQLDDNQNELKSLNIVNTDEKIIPIVEEQLDVLNKELNPSTQPIMRSDFTNTIQMRKKSLENSLQKDKQLKPVSKSMLFEQPGKVSMLKNKFSNMQSQVSSNFNITTTTTFAKSKDCMDVLKLKRNIVTEACPNKTTSSSTSSTSSLHTQYSTSLPNSPIPTRKTNASSAFRLSDRVREVTDRLAQQQTVCTEARRMQKSPSPNRKKILSP